jgi:hypothetical protein
MSVYVMIFLRMVMNLVVDQTEDISFRWFSVFRQNEANTLIVHITLPLHSRLIIGYLQVTI